MEHRPVVPDIEDFGRQRRIEHVGRDPPHPAREWAEARASQIARSLGQIEHEDLAVACVAQAVDER